MGVMAGAIDLSICCKIKSISTGSIWKYVVDSNYCFGFRSGIEVEEIVSVGGMRKFQYEFSLIM